MHTKLLGLQAEKLAQKLLLSKGYTFVTRNYRTPFGEIDLIFVDKTTTVFVEVKARSRVEQGRPEEAVTPHKLKTITRVAQAFLQKYPSFPQRARIDVVALELTQSPPLIRYFQNVTG